MVGNLPAVVTLQQYMVHSCVHVLDKVLDHCVDGLTIFFQGI